MLEYPLIDQIINYCGLDVVITAKVFLQLRNEELLTDDEIKMVGRLSTTLELTPTELYF